MARRHGCVSLGARALIPYAPSLIYVMLLAGAVMGLSILVLTAGPLFEMWVRDRHLVAGG